MKKFKHQIQYSKFKNQHSKSPNAEIQTVQKAGQRSSVLMREMIFRKFRYLYRGGQPVRKILICVVHATFNAKNFCSILRPF